MGPCLLSVTCIQHFDVRCKATAVQLIIHLSDVTLEVASGPGPALQCSPSEGLESLIVLSYPEILSKDGAYPR